ncbi:hypothetical protein [Neoaquamicrobium sediminum]|uniref:hypothetical protein n=1 Tax=Neoaquamicrobium sediminum TaxID=1849104 RepID=UPI00156309A6|nr:hypothetical protein [Mesorhizobium sediminum]NRC54180.1 hypothetical protein [Mesorhizobium sediminum]
MAHAMDTLAFTKHLRAAGIDERQAEAHAEAVREFVMPELATKADIAELKHTIERQTLVLTVRLGGLVLVGVGALVALQRFGL